MSRENVEVVIRAIEAFDRRDLDAAFRDVDPEIELDWSRSRGVEAGIYRGIPAGRDFWGNFLDMFDPFIITPEETIDHGDNVVVALHSRLSGRDGIEVETRNTIVVTLRAGCIARWTLYNDHAEALKAVGLEE